MERVKWPHGSATGYRTRKCRCDACREWNRLRGIEERRKKGIMPPRARPTAEEFEADLSDPRHGSDNGYTNIGCRCSLCTEAHRRAQQLKIGKMRQQMPEEKHGTLTGYINYGCRCNKCVAARAERRRVAWNGYRV